MEGSPSHTQTYTCIRQWALEGWEDGEGGGVMPDNIHMKQNIYLACVCVRGGGGGGGGGCYGDEEGLCVGGL